MIIKYRKITTTQNFDNPNYHSVKTELFDIGEDGYNIWESLDCDDLFGMERKIIKNYYERTEIDENGKLEIHWKAIKSDDTEYSKQITNKDTHYGVYDKEKYDSLEKLYQNYIRSKKLDRICLNSSE